MRTLKLLSLSLLVVFASACSTAPTAPIAMVDNAITPGSTRVALQLSKVPEPDTSFPGAGCLLCLAVAAAAHGDLTNHVQTLPSDAIDGLVNGVTSALRKQGATVIPVTKLIDIDSLDSFEKGDAEDIAEKDHTVLRKQLMADKLFVISVSQHGVSRNYSSYVPQGEPRAFLEGAAYLIDLRTNRYDFYLPLSHYRNSPESWNEPPGFPGLTNAYYQVAEHLKDVLANSVAPSEMAATSTASADEIASKDKATDPANSAQAAAQAK